MEHILTHTKLRTVQDIMTGITETLRKTTIARLVVNVVIVVIEEVPDIDAAGATVLGGGDHETEEKGSTEREAHVNQRERDKKSQDASELWNLIMNTSTGTRRTEIIFIGDKITANVMTGFGKMQKSLKKLRKKTKIMTLHFCTKMKLGSQYHMVLITQKKIQ